MNDQPVFSALNVALHVGGIRYAVSPSCAPAFPESPGLSLDDLRLAVERLHAARLTGDRLLTGRLGMWPAPDPFEHPRPAAVWSLLRSAEIGEDAFQVTGESRLIPTDGWRVGTDSNWRALLEDLQRVGVRHVWFTFLGLERTHDELCGCPGAFAAIVSGLERCSAVGLETGANIVVSTRNTQEIGELAERIRALGAERFVPTYVDSWTPLSGAYELLRPEPSHLVGLPPAGLDVNWGYALFWANPEGFTEGALTRAALPPDASNGIGDSGDDAEDDSLALFVDGNMDVFVGSLVAPPVQHVANLRHDTPEQVYAKLVALELPPPRPPDADLAARYGDAQGRQVHMSLFSLRRKWVAAWRAEHGLPWLAAY